MVMRRSRRRLLRDVPLPLRRRRKRTEIETQPATGTSATLTSLRPSATACRDALQSNVLSKDFSLRPKCAEAVFQCGGKAFREKIVASLVEDFFSLKPILHRFKRILLI